MSFDEAIKIYNNNVNKINKEAIIRHFNFMVERIDEITDSKDNIEIIYRFISKVKKWMNGGDLEEITKTEFKKFVKMFEKFQVKYSKTEEEKLYNHFIGNCCTEIIDNLNRR